MLRRRTTLECVPRGRHDDRLTADGKAMGYAGLAMGYAFSM